MRRSEGGFSLIELLVSIVVLGSIGGALGEAVILGLRTTDVANERLGVSRQAQLAAAWFATDVQSANVVAPSTEAACVPAVEAGWTREALVRLTVIEGTTEASVSYAAERGTTGTTTVRRLRRTSCAAGTVRSHVVADDLAAAPVLTCDSAACPTPTSPRRMSIELVGGGGYRYELSGTRRVLAAQ